MLLRLFAKRETLALLYTNLKTGNTIFPALRPGPDVQQKEILGAFWGFYSDASSSMAIPGVTEFSLARDSYRFYARYIDMLTFFRTDGIHRLYLLLANEATLNDVPLIAMDVLKNLKAF